MYVIGTAGHVDHGKSALVKALTNIDPDRLPEEKQREMTIDLGFAWWTLPSGKEISIVDVPGHERFIKNMLAGVGAINVAILVIAADEGVMPQTREHISILEILNVDKIVVAITKIDLVGREMIQMVEIEANDLLSSTRFRGSQVISVSSRNGSGIRRLSETIDELVDLARPRENLGRPRLSVDRSFSVSGFGTVVTGVLIDGCFTVGQEVYLARSGNKSRIRRIQSHKKDLTDARPGTRIAVNLSGISRHQVGRGEVLIDNQSPILTARVDARLTVSAHVSRTLKHNQQVTFHVFTTESSARIRILDHENLIPGQDGLVQIHLKSPVYALRGDRFVIRTSDETLGGGYIIDAHPRRRHRRFVSSILESLMTIENGGEVDSMLRFIDESTPTTSLELAKITNLSIHETLLTLGSLHGEGKIILLGTEGLTENCVIYSARKWDLVKDRANEILKSYHRDYPTRQGIPKEEFRSRLDYYATPFQQVVDRLVMENIMMDGGVWVSMQAHMPILTADQRKIIEGYLNALQNEPYSPPTDLHIDSDLLTFLINKGMVVKVNSALAFSNSAYKEMVDKIVIHLNTHGKITVAEGRDLLNTSRKYILPLLEYLDQQRITRRVGDQRVLR